MAKSDTVATLNQTAGKTSPGKRKRTGIIDTSEISFSSRKKTKTTGGLTRKSADTPTTARGRRNSLTLPEDTIDASNVPVQKRVRKLKQAQESATNLSPLKQMGYSPKEIPAPGRVNLNESPAKRPRNRKAIVFPPNSNDKDFPSASTPRKRPTRQSVKNGEIEPPPETWDKDRELAAYAKDDDVDERYENASKSRVEEPKETNNDDAEGDEVGKERDEASDKDHTTQRVSDDAGETQSNGASPTTSKQKRKRHSTAKPLRKRKSNAQAVELAEPSAAEQDDQNQNQPQNKRWKMPAINSVLQDNKDDEKLIKAGKIFVKPIAQIAEWHDCMDDWLSLGGIARQMRSVYLSLRPKSQQCTDIKADIQKLCSLFRECRLGNISTESARIRIMKATTKLEGDRAALSDDKLTASIRRAIIIDLYQQIIPEMIFAIRGFLRCYVDTEDDLMGWELKHFVHLLEIANSFCEQAVIWKPQPTTMDDAERRDVRDHVQRQLQHVYTKYKVFRDETAQRDVMTRQMAELRAAQEHALADFARRRQEMFDKIRKNKLQINESRRLPSSTHILDIDDLDLFDLPLDGGNSRYEPLPTPISARPRLERQATEDIAPPPMDWSEDEKAALLNALEIYHGEDRYWQIQDACVELQNRSLDDLRTAALYFRELIESAAELSGLADSAFAYLLSVE